MKIGSKEIKYLSGEEFSSGMQFLFSTEKYEDLYRAQKVVQLVKNKRVVHIGCGSFTFD